MSANAGTECTVLHVHRWDTCASRTVSATSTCDTSFASRCVAAGTNSSLPSSARLRTSQFNSWLRTGFWSCSGAPYSSRNVARKHSDAAVGWTAVDSNNDHTSAAFTRHSLCFISAIIRCSASDWVLCTVTNLQRIWSKYSAMRTVCIVHDEKWKTKALVQNCIPETSSAGYYITASAMETLGPDMHIHFKPYNKTRNDTVTTFSTTSSDISANHLIHLKFYFSILTNVITNRTKVCVYSLWKLKIGNWQKWKCL